MIRVCKSLKYLRLVYIKIYELYKYMHTFDKQWTGPVGDEPLLVLVIQPLIRQSVQYRAGVQQVVEVELHRGERIVAYVWVVPAA